ncbi:histidine kinase [Dysgonomonas sp. 25]|uniref:histidine kinase n=1 Tax=Dysgonomonas sp. 25 TaxID=2302933 RepID=UPI0013D6463A|nr:histidine kinase [Dysgonomonas sp. 25]
MKEQSLIYKFLLTPQFRIWRYIALTLFFSIVAINQSIITYGFTSVLGNKLYLIVGLTILIYVGAVYLLLRFFVPKYLFTGKYFRFIICILVAALIFYIIPNIVLLIFFEDNLFSITYIMDDFSAFIVYVLCISGFTIPVFLKSWIISNQHLQDLKKKQRLSQIEHLKEQIHPASFFKVLDESAALAKSDPDKSSSMLMTLSLLLRYQLYDCRREQVLLTAEISFLKNFLNLEALYSSRFNYTVTVSGKTTAVQVYPSILLPYIQSTIRTFRPENEQQKIDIHISVIEHTLKADLKVSGIDSSLLEIELLNVRERLETLYKNMYGLDIVHDELSDESEIGLTLELN